jgi:hypothetical protein
MKKNAERSSALHPRLVGAAHHIGSNLFQEESDEKELYRINRNTYRVVV